MGRLLIAPGASGFLDVVFQRSRCIEVDHQPHIGFVHAHAEGVGRGDDAPAASDELLLHRTLDVGIQAAVEVGAVDPGLLEKVGDRFGGLLLGAEDDDPALFAQRLFQQAQHLTELGLGRNRVDLVDQIVPAHAAFEPVEFQTQPLAEVRGDVVDDIGLGGGGEAEDRRAMVLLRGPDELGDVEIVGPEVVTPLRQTVRLVEDPGGDLAVTERLSEGRTAELLGGDEDQPQIAQPQLVEHGAALDGGQHPIEIARTGDAARNQVVDLILHQRLQRRDHHRQRAGAIVAGQGRQLEAQRLAAARGEDRQRGLTAKSVLDDGPLQRASVWRRGLGAKAGDAGEVDGQQPVEIMLFAAPGALRIVTGPIAQGGDGLVGLGKGVPHPGRQHRASARHTEPRQRIGQRLAPLGIREPVCNKPAMSRETDLALCRPCPGGDGFLQRWRRAVTHGAEDPGRTGVFLAAHERVQTQQRVG